MHTYSYLHRKRTLGRRPSAWEKGGLALLFTAAAAYAQTGLGLTPMREEIPILAGATRSGVLTVSNSAREKVRITGEVLDFYLDGTGTPQFGTWPREKDYSCRQWLSMNPMDFELAGESITQVRYTARVPAGVGERSYHCALSFTTQPTAAQGKGTGLRTNVQIVSSLYLVVGKPAVEGTVKDLKLERVSDKNGISWQAVVVLNNPSNMHYRPSGDLDVLDAAGSVVESVKFVPLPVLPKRDQNFVFPLKLAAGPGTYTLRARVDLGGDEIQEASARVTAAK